VSALKTIRRSVGVIELAALISLPESRKSPWPSASRGVASRTRVGLANQFGVFRDRPSTPKFQQSYAILAAFIAQRTA